LQWDMRMIHATVDGSYAVNQGSKDVLVGVMDTGIDGSHPDIAPNFNAALSRNFTRDIELIDGPCDNAGPDPCKDPADVDDDGHGTHVASTIAETTNNGVSLTGLAYNARIMPVRVLDSQGEGDAATIADGVRFAAKRGAKIINLSLEFSSDVGASEIPELLDALAFAHRRGAMVIGASGNEAHRAVAYPARAKNVISVGATTIHGCLSDFSNDGRGLDMVAPGGGADAQLPDDVNCKPNEPPGPDVYQLTLIGTSVRRFGLPSGYEGTSMAVPHVSATAALIIASRVLGANPSPAALERRLKQTATDLGPAGVDIRYGAGLINAGRATDPAIPVG